MGKIIWNQKLLKSILIPTLGISAIGSITVVSTSCEEKKSAVVPVTSVELNKSETTLGVGETETLTATVLPTDATDKSVTWTSSDTNVATVDSNGTITAKSARTTTITATSVDNPNAKVTCEVIVTSPYIAITANEDSTLSLQNNGGNNPNLQYSIDGTNWSSYGKELRIPQGYNIYLRGNNPTGWSHSNTLYSTLSITGNVSISGNVMGLLDNGAKSGEQGDITAIPCDYCFINLFQNSVAITSVSDSFLPATTLANYCYCNMFLACTSLTMAPELPATTLADDCYGNMFQFCTSLTTAPELPATTLAYGCYWAMFQDCTSLTTAPALPATTLATSCYRSMFQGCASLTTVPKLPATTLAYGCYYAMFLDCWSLTTAPELPATDLNAGCYWFIFSGCSSLWLIKIGYIGNYDSIYFENWVNGVGYFGKFYYNGSQTAQDFGFPSAWTKSPF